MNYLTQSDYQFLKSLRNEVRRSLAATFDQMFGRKSPTIVGASIIIVGEESCDMYDHAPGFAYFNRNGHRCIDTPVFADIEELRVTAIKGLEELESYVSFEEYDGMFRPLEVRIHDGDGQTIDLCEALGRNSRVWLSDSNDQFPEKEWENVEAKIKALLSEASFEAAWDNFDSARRLRNEAAWLQERLSLSRQLAA